MEMPSAEVGSVAELTDQLCKVKVGEQVLEVDRLHGPVLVPAELIPGDQVKVIVVNGGVRHIEKLSKEEAEKIATEDKKEIRKIPKRIKTDQFFRAYEKGFKQKVFMYKVGSNDFRGDPPKILGGLPHKPRAKKDA